MPTPQNFWEDLFAAPEGQGQGVRIEMRLVRKAGRPFLLLPGQPRAAAATMDLYPAQTGRARLARALFRGLLRGSLPLGTEALSLAISPGDAFVKFLSSLAGEPGQDKAGRAVPCAPGTGQRRAGDCAPYHPFGLGIFAGNPASDGQRFLLLVFDASQRPVAVVKAGLSPRARALVEQEERFLAAVPEKTVAVPRLCARFESSRLRALALDFIPGDSPRLRDEVALAPLLAAWVDATRTIVLSDAPDWTRLQEAAPAGSLFSVVAGQLRGRKVHPAMHHGDFAPWNIKVSPAGAWTVLDWERSELTGIPGWDWFHYVIQSGILVGHLPTSVLIQRVESLLGSGAFRQYAARGFILGCECELVLAYLLHMVEVVRPSQGLAPTRELLEALAARWRKGAAPPA
jgi:hypothetical protein